MTVEIGTRYFYRGRTYIVRERELRPDKGNVKNPKTGVFEPEHYLCLSPEERATDRPHWTDWVSERQVQMHYTEIAAGEVVEITKPRTTHVEQAVAEARKAPVRAAITPKKRLQNRITSTRYKLKHPEKNGRSEWTGSERAEMERTIEETKTEIEALA